jgi:hypothetical protein
MTDGDLIAEMAGDFNPEDSDTLDSIPFTDRDIIALVRTLVRKVCHLLISLVLSHMLPDSCFISASRGICKNPEGGV